MHLPRYKGLKIILTLVLIGVGALILNRMVPLRQPTDNSPVVLPEAQAAPLGPPPLGAASPVVNPALPIKLDSSPASGSAPAKPEPPSVSHGLPADVPTAPEISVKQLKWREELWYLNDQLFTGIATDAHPDGKPRIRWPMKDGKFHGVVEEYYPNGQRSTETYYANGLHHGSNTYWNPDGTLQAIKIWNQDNLVHEEKPR